MTFLNAIPAETATEVTALDMAPPLAPMNMPKQVLTREPGALWRGFGTLLSQLRRDLGRAG